MIDFPSNFTDEEKSLYLEYLVAESIQNNDKNWNYCVNAEKGRKLQKIMDKVKSEENHRDGKRKAMLFKLQQNFQKSLSQKNYFKKFQR